jgi:hypothetical protein
MKGSLILPLLLLVTAVYIGAQEPTGFALGFGVEGNNNTRKGVALGENLYFTYSFNNALEAGLQLGINYDFQNILALEPMVMGRWYFYDLFGGRIFAQADLGATLILEGEQLRPLALGGLALGIRFPLGAWFVEPYARGGYPFMWGAGVNGGYRF